MKENNIEEDIKIVENYLAHSAINETDSDFFKNGGWETVDLEIPKSMQHILSDYKRVLKENEELRTEVNSLKEEKEQYKNDYFNLYEQNKQYIHYSKIEELAEKIHNELDKNGITRAYQIIIDSYFDEVLGG